MCRGNLIWPPPCKKAHRFLLIPRGVQIYRLFGPLVPQPKYKRRFFGWYKLLCAYHNHFQDETNFTSFEIWQQAIWKQTRTHTYGLWSFDEHQFYWEKREI